jgi:phosphomannomutase
MIDYISNQYFVVELSPVYDYCSKKVKFKPDNFTDAAIKSCIQELEERFLINHRKTNKLCPKITYSSLHGPASDYLKKVFANFGFPSLIVPEVH